MQNKKQIPEFVGTKDAQFTQQELTALAELIDVATRKGIFTAVDLQLWGNLYRKVIGYLPKGANTNG